MCFLFYFRPLQGIVLYWYSGGETDYYYKVAKCYWLPVLIIAEDLSVELVRDMNWPAAKCYWLPELIITVDLSVELVRDMN